MKRKARGKKKARKENDILTNSIAIGAIAMAVMTPFFLWGYQMFQPEYVPIFYSGFIPNTVFFLTLTILILYITVAIRGLNFVSILLSGVFRWVFINFVMFGLLAKPEMVIPNAELMKWEFFVMTGGYVIGWGVFKRRKKIKKLLAFMR